MTMRHKDIQPLLLSKVPRNMRVEMFEQLDGEAKLTCLMSAAAEPLPKIHNVWDPTAGRGQITSTESCE